MTHHYASCSSSVRRRESYPQITPMAQIFRDPQISQMTRIPDPGLDNHGMTIATLGRNRGYVPLWAPSL
jgi:hypothetical protein